MISITNLYFTKMPCEELIQKGIKFILQNSKQKTEIEKGKEQKKKEQTNQLGRPSLEPAQPDPTQPAHPHGTDPAHSLSLSLAYTPDPPVSTFSPLHQRPSMARR